MNQPVQPTDGAEGDVRWTCPTCGRLQSATTRFCPACGRRRPPSGIVLPAPARGSAPHSRSRAGNGLGQTALGALVFLLAAGLWTLLFGRVIGPAIIGHTPITELRRAAHTLAVVLFAGTAAAGYLSGALVAWRARRATVRRSLLVLRAASAPAVGIALLLLISYPTHQPIEVRPAEVHAAVSVLAALLAGAMIAALPARMTAGRGRPAVAQREAGQSDFRVSGVLCALLVSSLMSWPTRAIDQPRLGAAPSAADHDRRATVAVAPDPNDIKREECAVSAEETKFAAGFTLFSLDLGASWTFLQTEMKSGSWQDAVDVGVKAGFKMTVGEHLLTSVFGHGAGQGLSVSGGAHDALDVTSTFTDLSKSSADDVIRWSLNRYGLSALALPGLTQLVLPTLASQPVKAKVDPPKSSEVKLGGAVTLDLEAGAGISYKTTLDVGVDAAVALEDDNNSDPRYVTHPGVVEFAVGLSGTGSASAMAPIGGGLSAHVDGDAVLAIKFKRETGDLWLPESLSVESTFKLTGAVDTELAAADLFKQGSDKASLLPRLLKALKFNDSDERGGSLELSGSVDLSEHPEVLAAAAELISAARAVNGHTPTAQQQARYEAALRQLASLIDRDAVLRGKLYQVTAGSAGIDLEAGDGLAFGASIDRDHTSETLLGGFYRDASRTWRSSAACQPGT